MPFRSPSRSHEPHVTSRCWIVLTVWSWSGLCRWASRRASRGTSRWPRSSQLILLVDQIRSWVSTRGPTSGNCRHWHPCKSIEGAHLDADTAVEAEPEVDRESIENVHGARSAACTFGRIGDRMRINVDAPVRALACTEHARGACRRIERDGTTNARVVHGRSLPVSGGRTPKVLCRRRPRRGRAWSPADSTAASASDSPGSLAPGHARSCRGANQNDLSIGCSGMVGDKSRGSGAPLLNTTPNISAISRSCHAAPGNRSVIESSAVSCGKVVRTNNESKSGSPLTDESTPRD